MHGQRHVSKIMNAGININHSINVNADIETPLRGISCSRQEDKKQTTNTQHCKKMRPSQKQIDSKKSK